jgi:predicted metal-dependent peptidase
MSALPLLDNKPPRIPKPTPCALTPIEEKKWEETRVALLWKCPAFTHILYSMLDQLDSKHVAMFTKDIPTAATDGVGILINPEFFFKLNLYERVFVLAHEIMHAILNHCILGWNLAQRGKVRYSDGKELPYEQTIMNIAMDLVINDVLVDGKIGTMPQVGAHDPKVATHADSFLDAYRKIFEQAKKGGKGGKGDGKSGFEGKGFDDHLAPGQSQGKDPSQAKSERNEAEWNTNIAAAAQAARVQGKLPAGLDRLLKELLEPAVDWREKIQALFARRLGNGSYDWRRPDRRLIVRDIYSPGRSGFGSECVVVGADTSGSIGERELSMFFAEVSGILEDVRPKRLFLVWCDAQVHRVDELNDPSDLNTVRCKGAPGGGGTSFVPVFDWIAKQGLSVDALVYLTDGMGTFPDKAPNYPVIWGNIYPQSKYPFGDVVDIPVQSKE